MSHNVSTQSLNPQVSREKKVPFNRRTPGAGPGSEGGSILLRKGWEEEEKKKEKTGQSELDRDANIGYSSVADVDSGQWICPGSAAECPGDRFYRYL